MFCPPRLCFIKSLPPMLHPTELQGVSCQQGISIPPKSCVNKLHEIAFTDYLTNIYPWSHSKPTRSKNASMALVVYWMSVYLHRASGHLSCKAGSIKSHPLKTEAGWAELPLYLRHRELHLTRGNSETYRKTWIQNSSCSPWPVLHPSQCSHLFLFRYVCKAYIHTTKNNLIFMHTLFFFIFIFYLFSSSAYTQCNSVVCVCVCFKICCYDQDLQAKKKKFSLFLFPPPVSRSRCCSHSSLCLCYRSNW